MIGHFNWSWKGVLTVDCCWSHLSFLTICQFALPECFIEALAQSDVSLILCTLHKLLQFKVTWSLTLPLYACWLVITLVRYGCCCILLISWLLCTTGMTSEQGTTNSMTLQTEITNRAFNSFWCYPDWERGKVGSKMLFWSTKTSAVSKAVFWTLLGLPEREGVVGDGWGCEGCTLLRVTTSKSKSQI